MVAAWGAAAAPPGAAAPSAEPAELEAMELSRVGAMLGASCWMTGRSTLAAARCSAERRSSLSSMLSEGGCDCAPATTSSTSLVGRSEPAIGGSAVTACWASSGVSRLGERPMRGEGGPGITELPMALMEQPKVGILGIPSAAELISSSEGRSEMEPRRGVNWRMPLLGETGGSGDATVVEGVPLVVPLGVHLGVPGSSSS
mmetsp:Transcript_47656/g.123020  ORF Transcript_47656/g.123020 Transcript_47656/m.123020 type:complete len:201 (-) Transcript_47656:118-720(-)